MGFKLWLHDTQGNNSITKPSTIEGLTFDKLKEYKVQFTTNMTKAIRIHLHCLAGAGSIIVTEVKVIKVNN